MNRRSSRFVTRYATAQAQSSCQRSTCLTRSCGQKSCRLRFFCIKPWTGQTLLLMLRAMCATNFAHETAGFPRGDLFSLAQSLAALAGGAISIVDMSSRVVGYSTLPDQPIDEVRRSTTLALQEAESPRVDRDHLALSRSAKALWFPAGEAGTFSRAALSVRAQNQQIGSVWLHGS